jgi:hypothetical protein
MNRRFVIEIAIALVDRHPRRRNGHQDRARSAPDDLVMLAGRDHDHLVAEPLRSAEFRLDIGAHPAAGGRVKGAYVGDPHRP